MVSTKTISIWIWATGRPAGKDCSQAVRGGGFFPRADQAAFDKPFSPGYGFCRFILAEARAASFPGQ
jgi:hypothetical protein